MKKQTYYKVWDNGEEHWFCSEADLISGLIEWVRDAKEMKRSLKIRQVQMTEEEFDNLSEL